MVQVATRTSPQNESLLVRYGNPSGKLLVFRIFTKGVNWVPNDKIRSNGIERS